MTHKNFYVSRFVPNANWPNGGFSVYEINADDIARRVGFDTDGNVNRRDGLPGYLGTFATADEVMAVMEDRTR